MQFNDNLLGPLLFLLIVPFGTLMRGWLGSSSRQFDTSFKDGFQDLRYGWVVFLTVGPVLLLVSFYVDLFMIWLIGACISAMVTYFKLIVQNTGGNNPIAAVIGICIAFGSWLSLFVLLWMKLGLVNRNNQQSEVIRYVHES